MDSLASPVERIYYYEKTLGHTVQPIIVRRRLFSSCCKNAIVSEIKFIGGVIDSSMVPEVTVLTRGKNVHSVVYIYI